MANNKDIKVWVSKDREIVVHHKCINKYRKKQRLKDNPVVLSTFIYDRSLIKNDSICQFCGEAI